MSDGRPLPLFSLKVASCKVAFVCYALLGAPTVAAAED